MAVKVSLKELIESGAHFGHQRRRWNPKMKQYIYGEMEGAHVFDLVKTKAALEEVLKVLIDAAKNGKSILFLGTKKQAKEKIAEVAKSAECFYVNERWLGGTITNFDQIKKSIDKLADMKKDRAAGEYKKFTKKEGVLIDREITRLERFFGGISQMTNVPDLLIVVDVKREVGAVKEAFKGNVVTVGMVDSNSDPTSVDHAIPMNDDATKAVSYVLDLMRDAIIEGRKKVRSKNPKAKS